MSETGRKVVVAMSGGVDSSVAALLLKRQGWDVTGLFMRSGLSEGPPEARSCCSQSDALDARRVAVQIGVPFYVLNFADDFDRLIDYFVSEYGRGRTPNPCIVCNRDLKFGRLLDYANTIGAEAVATGHYARLADCDGERALLRSVDPGKDQSYALFPIPYERLARVVLPLGEQTKDDSRRIAAEHGLRVHDKQESQDACFVAGDYADLIRERRPELLRPGPIVDECGREVGRHPGIAAFTIGQRRGVRVAFGEPRYVVRLDAETATVHVGPHEHLLARGLLVEDVNWLTGRPPREGETIEAAVKIRYRHSATPAEVRCRGGRVEVRFAEPQRAVTPGQAAVFYVGDRVLGGGWIARALSGEEPSP
ncbi:MAG: tRNA 2-thiouridine(34) synthase MnmA [Planctomycetes bacterium]|nr:tRNA 2-thiouridine(34) synthase MnmA [Planctomycetota bacterium]